MEKGKRWWCCFVRRRRACEGTGGTRWTLLSHRIRLYSAIPTRTTTKTATHGVFLVVVVVVVELSCDAPQRCHSPAPRGSRFFFQLPFHAYLNDGVDHTLLEKRIFFPLRRRVMRRKRRRRSAVRKRVIKTILLLQLKVLLPCRRL